MTNDKETDNWKTMDRTTPTINLNKQDEHDMTATWKLVHVKSRIAKIER